MNKKLNFFENLNPDCPLHGTESVWYNDPEQVKRREERSQRIRRTTLFEVVSILQNVPNPKSNRAAIHKILNHVEMELK